MRDLGDISYTSLDNLLNIGDKVEHLVKKLITSNNRFIMVGGEHSISYFSVKALAQHFKGKWIAISLFALSLALAPLLDALSKIAHYVKSWFDKG